MAVRLGETVQIDGGYKGADGRDQLLSSQLCRKGRVDCLSLNQYGNRALRVLREESLRGGLAVDESEVCVVARVFAARYPVADGGGFQILRCAIVEERSGKANRNAAHGRQRQLVAPEWIFPARRVADQRVMRTHGRRHPQGDWRSSPVRQILGPVKDERPGEEIIVP